MSWDQSYFVESKQQFLARLVDIDIEKLVSDEIARRMSERGIEVLNAEESGRIDDMFGPPDPLMRITLKDGRTFVHKKVRCIMGDDYGHEDWELRPEGEEIVVERTYYDSDVPDTELDFCPIHGMLNETPCQECEGLHRLRQKGDIP